MLAGITLAQALLTQEQIGVQAHYRKGTQPNFRQAKLGGEGHLEEKKLTQVRSKEKDDYLKEGNSALRIPPERRPRLLPIEEQKQM